MTRPPRILPALLLACALAIGLCVVIGRALAQESASAPVLADRAHAAATAMRASARAAVGAPSAGGRPAQPSITSEIVRMWVAEGGWHAYRAHAVMAHVLRRHALRRGWTLQRAIDAEVWRHSNALRDRPWLRGLTTDCERPARWPWRRWPAQACERLAVRAEAFMRGELPDPCPQARGWRSVGRALDRALARGFVRVRCGVSGPAFVRWA